MLRLEPVGDFVEAGESLKNVYCFVNFVVTLSPYQ